MAEQQKMVSLNPDDFTSGGLALSDVDGLVKKARFGMFDYQGKADPVPAIIFDIQPEGEDDVHTQYWSCGSPKDWAPSADGDYLVPLGSATALRMSSNAAALFRSMVDNGFPKNLMTGSAKVFEGLKAHFVQQEAPTRVGMETKKKKGADGKEYAATILVVSKILSLPGEKKGAAAAATAASTDEVKDTAKNLVMEIILEAGGQVAKKDIGALAYKKVDKTNPQRNVLLQMVMKDDFLKENFSLEAGIVKMKE